MIALETARQLLDFAGGNANQKARVSEHRAQDQLEGAVALHNILEKEGSVAYLADEVGLGKTYVALGAFALFRHFDPHFRLLVIAPKENLQRKWIKEVHSFVRNNVRFSDLRVKSVHGAPARPPVYCGNLYELARETVLDPDRDFFARLTSFSFGLTDDSEGWKKQRTKICELLPWIDQELFDLRGGKQRFKENYARAIGCALPSFDLVIVDEGHNLKHGLQKSAAHRNRLLSLVLGNDTATVPRTLRGYARRAKRVLFLSATPVEDDYSQIWNQLDVVGFGDVAPKLRDRQVTDEEKRGILADFLIRRVSNIRTPGGEMTKNLYRREWRAGGVAVHDEPLPVPDERQRLIVALVQKKVSELLDDARFNHSFQIGMLASFESFLRTARIAASDDEGTFDDSEQTDDAVERQGVDVDQVNRLAEDYEKHFRLPMPHPKMNALVETLRGAFDSGRKALVFVRRVASVTEIEQKLEAEYDQWLIARLFGELNADLRPGIDNVYGRYRADRGVRRKMQPPLHRDVSDPELEDTFNDFDDAGGLDTFFAWYFRGEGPEGVLSGAALAKRFQQPQFALSSFFEDNHVAALLDVRPGTVFSRLCRYLRRTEASVRTELERRAGMLLRADQKRRRHKHLFVAFQAAALSVIAEARGNLRNDAIHLRRDMPKETHEASGSVPLGDWLERFTFFTELRSRQSLYRDLWVPAAEDDLQPEQRLARRELRRELIASMFRLGHASIDLYVTVVNRLGRLDRAGDGDDLDNQHLAHELLDLLERQRDATLFRAYQELHEAATHFDLIIDANAPSLWDKPPGEVSREIGRLLREQQPIGGMWGEVSKTLVAQFRMPGYPLVLITTDLLQEGEDLHLFCSDVHHYGISWMPSSMEQRIGRIDRVRSQTERRLTTATAIPTGDDLLQVYFPHLRETIEVFQVRRVLERMDRFIRLMHHDLAASNDGADRRIHLLEEIDHGTQSRDLAPPELLHTAFPVRRKWLRGPRQPLEVGRHVYDDLVRRFQRIQDQLCEEHAVQWETRVPRNARVGTLAIGDRKQGFTLFLHSLNGRPLLRCVSPVGELDPDAHVDRIASAARPSATRVGAVYDPRFRQYRVTMEADVLLGTIQADLERAWWLIHTTTSDADALEAALLDADHDVGNFRDSLEQEPHFER